MGFSRPSAGAVPSTAGRGRASSGNRDPEGYSGCLRRPSQEASVPAVGSFLGPAELRPWKGCGEFQG